RSADGGQGFAGRYTGRITACERLAEKHDDVLTAAVCKTYADAVDDPGIFLLDEKILHPLHRLGIRCCTSAKRLCGIASHLLGRRARQLEETTGLRPLTETGEAAEADSSGRIVPLSELCQRRLDRRHLRRSKRVDERHLLLERRVPAKIGSKRRNIGVCEVACEIRIAGQEPGGVLTNDRVAGAEGSYDDAHFGDFVVARL